jgi:Na+-driven multidrug efflux pump
MRLHESFFALFGGPLAWFIQLTASFALVSQMCLRGGERTWTAMIAVTVAACLIALLATLVSWRAYARTKDEKAGDHRHVLEVGSGRTRFLALWGVMLGAGSAMAIALTAVAFFVLPRCAG